MSKAFALAGGRLGYLAAAPEVTDALRLVRLPYHLSAVTQATAIAALEHGETLMANVERIKEQRDRIVVTLRQMGLDPKPRTPTSCSSAAYRMRRPSGSTFWMTES